MIVGLSLFLFDGVYSARVSPSQQPPFDGHSSSEQQVKAPVTVNKRQVVPGAIGNRRLVEPSNIRPTDAASVAVQRPKKESVPAKPQAVQRTSSAPSRNQDASPGRRPLRQSVPAQSGIPEFQNGFPEGFTRGLPSFDFQGRMPEPDTKSDGFMGDILSNFPTLKTFGGFDSMPDVHQAAASSRIDPRVVGSKPLRRSSSVSQSGSRSS